MSKPVQKPKPKKPCKVCGAPVSPALVSEYKRGLCFTCYLKLVPPPRVCHYGCLCEKCV